MILCSKGTEFGLIFFSCRGKYFDTKFISPSRKIIISKHTILLYLLHFSFLLSPGQNGFYCWLILERDRSIWDLQFLKKTLIGEFYNLGTGHFLPSRGWEFFPESTTWSWTPKPFEKRNVDPPKMRKYTLKWLNLLI